MHTQRALKTYAPAAHLALVTHVGTRRERRHDHLEVTPRAGVLELDQC